MPPGGESVANRDVDVVMDVFIADLLGDDGVGRPWDWAAQGGAGGDERPQLVANKLFGHT
jgi:hypothetical protein